MTASAGRRRYVSRWRRPPRLLTVSAAEAYLRARHLETLALLDRVRCDRMLDLASDSQPAARVEIGAKGYLGARVQPNSPTDDVDDIRWQVFDGWSYAVGDVVLGTNPVSSDAGVGRGDRDRRCRTCCHVRPRRTCCPTACWRTSTCRPRSNSSSPGSHGAVVSEHRRQRRRQRDVRYQRRQDAEACRGAHGPVRAVLRDRAGGRLHQRARPWLRHGAARVAQVRLRASPEARGGRSAAARGRETGAVGASQRRRRLHRPGGLPDARATGAVLPGRHRDGQAARAVHRARRLLDAAHGRRRSTIWTGASTRSCRPTRRT